MYTRNDTVLNMQLALIPFLTNAWRVTFSQLSDIFRKYDVLEYIDACYENYNSTGNQGILEDLEEYIKMQGGGIA